VLEDGVPVDGGEGRLSGLGQEGGRGEGGGDGHQAEGDLQLAVHAGII
jgi:hypothetical protein